MTSARGAAIKAPADFLLKLQAHWGRRGESKKVDGKSEIMGREKEKGGGNGRRGREGKLLCKRTGNKNSTGKVRWKMGSGGECEDILRKNSEA